MIEVVFKVLLSRRRLFSHCSFNGGYEAAASFRCHSIF
jgi:hypothetical protein